ncbi:MAG: DUF3368 domain-containing protein [Chloroflexi bacterium]|nr:DUF3368 domain-containing protein [Chloroflexota bacterium]MCL5274489.1 DUF3368 domain-containing protein [Chloroflexota bacterium]
MIVVSNTGPIIALSQIGRLDLLPALFGRIFIPQAVRDELIQCRAQVDAADWIEVDSISDTSTVDVLRERLDAGESEAIALAIQLNADLVLIDEARGRRVADSRGLSYIGTLGLIVEAKRRGSLTAVSPLLEELRAAGLYMSDALYEAVRRVADEV